jgi:hypothetical protein
MHVSINDPLGSGKGGEASKEFIEAHILNTNKQKTLKTGPAHLIFHPIVLGLDLDLDLF